MRKTAARRTTRPGLRRGFKRLNRSNRKNDAHMRKLRPTTKNKRKTNRTKMMRTYYKETKKRATTQTSRTCRGTS